MAIARERGTLRGVEVQPGLIRLDGHRGIGHVSEPGLDRHRVAARRALGHGQHDAAAARQGRDRALRARERIANQLSGFRMGRGGPVVEIANALRRISFRGGGRWGLFLRHGLLRLRGRHPEGDRSFSLYYRRPLRLG